MIKHLGFTIKSELSEGVKVETEHADTIKKLKNNPSISLKEAEILIAKDHTKEAKDKGYKYYSRLIAAETLEDYIGIEGEIIKFFKESKNIKDETGIHELAKKLKINPHKLEEKIYAILKKIIGNNVNKSNLQLVINKEDEEFFKSLGIHNIELRKALWGTHKYFLKVGSGDDARYYYKEKKMEPDQYHRFMSEQANEMQLYRKQRSIVMGHDAGDEAYHEWIKLFSKKFRDLWMRKYHLVVFHRL